MSQPADNAQAGGARPPRRGSSPTVTIGAQMISRSWVTVMAVVALAASVAVRLRADALVTANESPTFTLDTRLPIQSGVQAALLVTAASPVFTLDTRLPVPFVPQGAICVAETPVFRLDTRLSTVSAPVSLVVVAESRVCALDTRLPAEASPGALLVTAESGGFPLDTRLSPTASGSPLLVGMESPAFALDTRLPATNPLLATLVTQTASGAFTLDTRLTGEDPRFTRMIGRAASGTFTLDTLSNWSRTPFSMLARSDTGGTGGRLCFSSDGLRLAKADGNRVLLWNLNANKPAVQFTGHSGQVNTLNFSPLGDQLLTASADGTLRWWDTASRAELGRVSPAGGASVLAACAEDGSRVLAGGGTALRLYRLPDMQVVSTLTGVEGTVTALALSAQAHLALAANSVRSVQVWDTTTGAMLQRLTGHAGLITSVALLPGGTMAITSSHDGTIRLWDLSTGVETRTFQQRSPVADAKCTPDGGLVVSCNYDSGPEHGGCAYLWDLAAGGVTCTFSNPQGDPSTVVDAAISPDHTMICTSHANGNVRVWDSRQSAVPIHPPTPLPMGTSLPLTLRSHGLYYFELDAEVGRSVVVTVEANPNAGGGPGLNSTGPGARSRSAGGLSADAEFANLGPRTTSNVRLQSIETPPANADITALRLTAAEGHLPSVYEYEHFAQAAVSDLHCEMPLAGATAGKIYVLVHSPHLAAGAINARISAVSSGFRLSSVSPTVAGNAGPATLEVNGTGITPNTTFRLVGPGGLSIPGRVVWIADSTRVYSSFDLSNAAIGRYQVTMEKPDSPAVSLAGTFQVASGSGPRLEMRLSPPAAARPGRDYNLMLEYANVGDADMTAPLFFVSNVENAPVIYRDWWTRATNRAVASATTTALSQAEKVATIQVLGMGRSGHPGVLRPGDRVELPIAFQVSGNVAQLQFTLGVLRADSTPIDWDALEPQLRPLDVVPDLSAAVWKNFKIIAGANWRGFQSMLNVHAGQLAESGQASANMDDLLEAAFAQSANTYFQPKLAAYVDASAPTPGLQFTFTRAISSGLEQRFRIGPLGRGWVHNFEHRLLRPETAGVHLRSPGGGLRTFTRRPDQTWAAAPGDTGVLAEVSGGAFALTEQDGRTWSFDASGLLLRFADLNGNFISLAYSDTNLTVITHSAGPSFHLEYDSHGRLRRLTDHAAAVTHYQYDAAGDHLLRVVAPDGTAKEYEYEPVTGSAKDHALTTLTLPDQTRQHFEWDAQGRLKKQFRDGQADLLEFSYDNAGLVSIREDSGGVTAMKLGPRGEVLQAWDPLGRTATFRYDKNLNLIEQTAPTGERRRFTRCDCGTLESITDELGNTTSFTYDPRLRLLTSLTDAAGNTTRHTYDTQGNLVSTIYPDGSAESFGARTDSGLPLSRTNRRGAVIRNAYDASGRVIRQTMPNGSDAMLHYDTEGRILVTTEHTPEGLEKITTYEYAHNVPGHPLRRVAYPTGRFVEFEYDALGRRRGLNDSSGQTVRYDYDATGRLWTARDGAGTLLVEYVYSPSGRLRRTTKGNGTFATYDYDAAGEILRLVNHAPDGSTNSFYVYSYDQRGRRHTMTSIDGTWTYSYDDAGQLTDARFVSARLGLADHDVHYRYDPLGNRVGSIVDGVTTQALINSLNQHTSVAGVPCYYDPDGNLISSGLGRCEYDVANRLVLFSCRDGARHFEYNLDGVCVATMADGRRTEFLVDPLGTGKVLAEYDDLGELKARNVYGPGLLARQQADGARCFYDYDALGSVIGVSDTDGKYVCSYGYWPFGECLYATGTFSNPFLFIGQAGVAQYMSGLFCMRSRFYSSAYGRFLSVDPVRENGGVNLYRYVGNDPVSRIDPLGTCPSGSSMASVLGSTDWSDVFGSTDWRDIDFGPPGGAGCGGEQDSEYVPDRVGSADLRRACELHDKCYECSPFKLGCDMLFYLDLVQSGLRPELAYVYYLAVQCSARSQESYDKAQKGDKSRCSPRPSGSPPVKAPKDGEPVGPAAPGHTPAETPVRRPIDPNDIVGPAGIGPNRVVAVSDRMDYTIRFENFATATAPVQEAVVVDYLDANLDWTTVELKEIAYGHRLITVPAGANYFSVRDLPPTNSPCLVNPGPGRLAVDVGTQVNPQTGRIEWRLTCVDTNTGWWPEDALAGFLPPEDGTGRGQGHVRFSVKPKAETPLGTVITNLATIVFDGNDPIDTPPVWNMVADVPPLAVTVACASGEAVLATPLTYTLTVTNGGLDTITNVALTNLVNGGMSFLSATSSVGSLSFTNGTFWWDVGEMTNGATASVTLIVLPESAGTFTNEVVVVGGTRLAIASMPNVVTVRDVASPPSLELRLLDTGIELSWPASARNYMLETAETLEPAGWSAVTDPPAEHDGVVSLQAPASDAVRFYRLKRN